MSYTKGPYGIQISESNKRFWLGRVKKDDAGELCVEEVIWTDTWNRRMEGTKERLLANAARLLAVLNACAGITTEALESGLIKHLLNDSFMRTLNPFNPNQQRKQDMTYLGKPVYEEDFEEDDHDK